MSDWATEIAIKVIKQGTTVESIAQALRDERSRAVGLCGATSIHGGRAPPFGNTWANGVNNARHDIANAIKDE